jgi:hypothetical protein
MPLGQPLHGISIINRARYWVVSKELKAYTEALRLRNEAMEEVLRGENLKVDYHGRVLTRVRRLSELRRIEERKIDIEMDRLEAEAERLADEREELRVKKLDRQLREMALRIQIASATRDLAHAENPPPEQPEVPWGKRTADEIARIHVDFEEIRAAIVAAAGGEDRLSERDKEVLEQAEIARRNSVSELLESGR